MLRSLVKRTPLRAPLNRLMARRRQRAEVAQWQRDGRPAPPPHLVKQEILLDFARAWGLKVLVETGTYRGDMVDAMLGRFDRIISIELGAELHAAARVRFAGRPEVELIQGDSGAELPKVVARLNSPSLFWLDGHYSAGDTARGELDTPIFAELACTLSKAVPAHVVLVDDARCFGRDAGYPTVAELSEYVRGLRPGARIVVEDDIIRITPH